MAIQDNNPEETISWETNIKDKISRLKNIVHKKGFEDVTAEKVEDCLNVLLKNNPDVCRALSDLEEIISYLEPGDDLGEVIKVFKNEKLKEENN